MQRNWFVSRNELWSARHWLNHSADSRAAPPSQKPNRSPSNFRPAPRPADRLLPQSFTSALARESLRPLQPAERSRPSDRPLSHGPQCGRGQVKEGSHGRRPRVTDLPKPRPCCGRHAASSPGEARLPRLKPASTWNAASIPAYAWMAWQAPPARPRLPFHQADPRRGQIDPYPQNPLSRRESYYPRRLNAKLAISEGRRWSQRTSGWANID